MADTRQIVLWTLEMGCKLRDNPESIIHPSKAWEAVSRARASQAGREGGRFGNYGDIHVAFYTYGSRPEGQTARDSPRYPASGFQISQEFEWFGGAETLFRMCQDCPANIRFHEIADCVGQVSQCPDSPEIEEQLRSIIFRLGLERDVASSFPKTTPIWYGLWAVSPVPPKSLPVLKILLSEMLRENKVSLEEKGTVDQEQLQEFSSIIAAIELAESRQLNLHVELLPPGHTDFGFYTVFPHCPFCKAIAGVALWQRKHPTKLQTCHVCGNQFSPAETASSERMEWDYIELRDLLGLDAFKDFARDYLIANGETPEDASAIVEETEAEKLEAEEKVRQNQELESRRQRFLQEHIFAGLDCLSPPSSEVDNQEKQPEEANDCTGWFDAADFAEVLLRCERYGIKITWMQHHSSDGEKDRFEMDRPTSPLNLLSKWQSEGCNEKFHAFYHVPDALIK